MRIWVNRAGENSQFFDSFRSERTISIGWAVGDCTAFHSKEDFREAYRVTFPEDTNNYRIGLQAGQIYRFAREMQTGDLVMVPNSPAREIAIGKIASDYRYEPAHTPYPHVRSVKWLRTFSRDDMSPALRGVTGAIMTVFAVDGFEEEVTGLATGLSTGASPPDQASEVVVEQANFYEDTRAKADELISDILVRIAPYDFQDLVAGLLRAMKFRTRVSPPGPDGGKDIVAHPDALGFEQPRVKVQVKHTKAAVGAPEVRNFRAVLGPSEKGLFVSTGGFTADARREPDRAGQPVELMDRDDFVDLLIEYYENLEPEFKAMVPLAKVYVPVRV